MNKFSIPTPVAALALVILLLTVFGFGAQNVTVASESPKQVKASISGIGSLSAKVSNLTLIKQARKYIDLSIEKSFDKEYCDAISQKLSEGIKVNIVYSKVPGWSKEVPNINCAYALNDAGANQYVVNKGVILDTIGVIDGKILFTNALMATEDSTENSDHMTIIVEDEKISSRLQKHIQSLFEKSKKFESPKKNPATTRPLSASASQKPASTQAPQPVQPPPAASHQ